MSWEVPAGGAGSAGFTNTGLGYNGTNLVLGDYTNSRIALASVAGAYASEIVLGGSPPANSVQGVAYDSSDGTYWVSHTAATNGTLRQYNTSGTLLTTISPAIGNAGPNGCVYDAVNDRILAVWANNVVRGYDCVDGSLDETITLSGLTGTAADGIAIDPTDPSTRIWVTLDGADLAGPCYLEKINRTTGASVSAVVVPANVEGIVFVGSDLYVCFDQGFHISAANGNRVWKIDTATGDETATGATQVASGSIDLSTSNAAQVIAGLGFVAKAFIFFGALGSAGAVELISFGVADAKARQWVECTRNHDAVTPTVCEKAWTSLYCFASTTGGGAYGTTVKFGSVTHDGFALQVVSDGNARRVHYLAIGGSDVSAYAGNFDLTTAGGTQAVTGPPFQPKALVTSMALSNITEGIVTTETRFGIGAMTSSAQWCMSYSGVDNVATSDEQGVGRTDAVLVRISNTLTTTALASYSSFDSGGFTLSKGTPPGANIRCGYLALGGAARYAVGAFNQPTSTGNQGVTGVGFTPLAELFVSAGRVSSTTPTAGSRTMIGAAISTTNRRAYETRALDGAATSDTARDWTESAALIACSDGGTPTRLATADFVSHNGNGFTLNWTTVDAVARQNFYLAFGAAPSSAPFFFTPPMHAFRPAMSGNFQG